MWGHNCMLVIQMHSWTGSRSELILRQMLLRHVNRSHVVVQCWVQRRIMEDRKPEGTLHTPSRKKAAGTPFIEFLFTHLYSVWCWYRNEWYEDKMGTKLKINEIKFHIFSCHTLFWHFSTKQSVFSTLCTEKLLTTLCRLPLYVQEARFHRVISSHWLALAKRLFQLSPSEFARPDHQSSFSPMLCILNPHTN